MKHFPKYLIFAFIFNVLFLQKSFAQKHKAIIEYRAALQQKYVDSFVIALNNKKDVSMAVKQQVAYNYNNANPEYFTLKINGDKSYYAQNKALETTGEYNMGSNAPNNDYYLNVEKKEIIEFNRYFGKIKLTPLKWSIESNLTRNIGGYSCYKATATQKLYSRKGHYYYKDIIAWFTPEIPLHFGPANFTGLPGLVLEIERDLFVISATKISLNPEEDIIITAITEKDKVITEKEHFKRLGAAIEEHENDGQ